MDSDGPYVVYTSDRHGSDEPWEVCRFHSDYRRSSLHSPDGTVQKNTHRHCLLKLFLKKLLFFKAFKAVMFIHDSFITLTYNLINYSLNIN